jgi:hypothetical protein
MDIYLRSPPIGNGLLRCAHISTISGASDNPDGDAERLEKDARQAVEEFLGLEREGK